MKTMKNKCECCEMREQNKNKSAKAFKETLLLLVYFFELVAMVFAGGTLFLTSFVSTKPLVVFVTIIGGTACTVISMLAGTGAYKLMNGEKV